MEKLEVSSKGILSDSTDYVKVENEDIRFWIERSIIERTDSLDLSFDSSELLRIEGINLVDLRPLK